MACKICPNSIIIDYYTFSDKEFLFAMDFFIVNKKNYSFGFYELMHNLMIFVQILFTFFFASHQNNTVVLHIDWTNT